MDKSSFYINRNGTLAYMGVWSQNIIEGFAASKSVTDRMMELDRREIFDRGALFLCSGLIKTLELKNTPK